MLRETVSDVAAEDETNIQRKMEISNEEKEKYLDSGRVPALSCP